MIIIGIGIANALYLRWQTIQHERVGRPMTCPFDGRCEDVVLSPYGTTFGVKNEISGILYYITLLAALLVYHFFVPAFLQKFEAIARYGIFGITIFAVLFSTYLLYIQFGILKKRCSWCIFASLINYAIFALEFFYFF